MQRLRWKRGMEQTMKGEEWIEERIQGIVAKLSVWMKLHPLNPTPALMLATPHCTLLKRPYIIFCISSQESLFVFFLTYERCSYRSKETPWNCTFYQTTACCF
jgi:hypothetical protein